jgi:ankyrin repeat protein
MIKRQLLVFLVAVVGCSRTPEVEQPMSVNAVRRNVVEEASFGTVVPSLVYWSSLGNLARVEEVLRSEPEVNVTDEGGYSAVHAAAENGHIEVLKLLIARGANLNPFVDGLTPLDLAITSGRSEVIALLTQHGATKSKK